MKTLFQAFARYNGSVNWDLAALLEPLTKEQIMKVTKAYYPSIFETCLHNLISDLAWLRRYRDALKNDATLNGSPLLSLDEKSLRGRFDSDYRTYFPTRKELDELIVRFVNGLEGPQINTVIRYKNYKGEEIEKEMWKTMAHWFNHQTHHRGQVSVLLDLIGVDHDFSSMVNRI